MQSAIIRPFYNQNGYTEFNNYVLDYIMPELSPNAWKVLCFIMRKTKGWQKEQDQLSFSQIMDGTGIKNRGTISSAITELEAGNYINVVHSDDRVTSNTYSLNTSYEIAIASTEIVLPSTKIVPPGSTKTVPEVVRKSYSQNKGLNKDIIITITPAGEISNHFSEKTNKWPKGTIDQQAWDADSEDILKQAGGDIQTAKNLIDEAIVTLDEIGYTYKTPASLLDTIDNLLKPKPQRKNGASKDGYTRRNQEISSKPKGRTGSDLAAEPYYDPATNEHVFPDGRRESVGAA